MDAISFTRRLVKGSELSYAEGDANLDATQTALEQLDSEKVGLGDAVEITETLTTLADDDEVIAFDTSDSGIAKGSTVGAIRAPLVTRLNGIDDLLEGLEAAIEAIL